MSSPIAPRVALIAGLLGLVACTEPQEPFVRLEAHGMRFTAPARVPAGLVRFRLVNQDPVWHEASIIRLERPDASLDAYVAAARAGNEYPGFVTDVGGVSMLAPGDSAEVMLPLGQGRYAVICWHRDHVLQGMGTEFIVGPGTGAPRLPQGDAPLVLRDFEIPALAVQPGPDTLHLHNDGPSEHEFVVLQLTPGRTLDDFLHWRAGGEAGPAPARPVAGSAALAPGTDAWVEVDWTPGQYVLLCLLEDPAGTLHMAKGMSRVITVPAALFQGDSIPTSP